MPRIFINYRRDDSAGYAGRIHERLASIFGAASVFMDLDDIQPGVDFVRAIEKGVASSDFVLVLIGKRWLDSRNDAGRKRLENPEDFVRIEIAKALERNKKVIPVLMDGARMPSETDLPADLRRLAFLQAFEISDERWDYDIGQLVKILRGGRPSSQSKRNRFIKPAGWTLALASMAVVLLLLFVKPSRDVSGRWMADVQYDFGARRSETFVFYVDQGALSGTASFLGVDRAILEGRIENNQISFLTRTEEIAGADTRTIQHDYRGTIDGDEIRFVMQTAGTLADHSPVQLVARRAVVPWSEVQAVLTMKDGRVVNLRAETLSNCISPNHGLDLAGGQSVEFEKIKSFDILRADAWQTPNAKARLRIAFLNGETTEESVAANCDLFGYNDRGRFSTYLEDVKRVDFQR